MKNTVVYQQGIHSKKGNFEENAHFTNCVPPVNTHTIHTLVVCVCVHIHIFVSLCIQASPLSVCTYVRLFNALLSLLSYASDTHTYTTVTITRAHIT